ncbi:alpha-galactosidase [Parastagonospora nodorum]|nr:alpha-galactosidase [Parastagonospora nodorum]KAH3998262.1 alpha-galactosidase [Parastagonospora nodorum]KAH4030109.1 alpha-galactosidase [Parastagonospora nodorum]KAH4076527.1 alpha-galactosidase [Parastagonospora nodorum]KAH4095992.1 alpha-galactosidase [Parastagonospora nodorum]
MSKMPLAPTDAPVWDIDLFDNPASTMATLKASGKIVVCYFSAGTAEDWRDDYRDFAAADLGKVLPEWPNEKWIRTGSQSIRNIMAKRIKLAADKGCDAIDPDNTDGYQNDNGLKLTSSDAINYMLWMQAEAKKYNMKIGLKNSLDIVSSLASTVDFAVNEQCAALGECRAYEQFLALNKPVFHIEYPTPLNAQAAKGVSCTSVGVNGTSTILKNLQLDGDTHPPTEAFKTTNDTYTELFSSCDTSQTIDHDTTFSAAAEPSLVNAKTAYEYTGWWKWWV